MKQIITLILLSTLLFAEESVTTPSAADTPFYNPPSKLHQIVAYAPYQFILQGVYTIPKPVVAYDHHHIMVQSVLPEEEYIDRTLQTEYYRRSEADISNGHYPFE